MRILIIEPIPKYGGGMEGVVVRLGKELCRRGHSVVLAYEQYGSMLDEYRSFSSKCVEIKLPGFALRQPLATATQLFQLASLIRAEKIDVILSSHLGFIPVCSLLKVATGVPAFFHLGLPGDNLSARSRRSLRWMGGGISPAPHTLLTWARAGWPLDRLWEVPNWVDPDEFRPSEDKTPLRAAFGIPPKAFCVGYVGRLVPEKGVEVLIAAFNELASQCDAFLMMVGGGDEEYVNFLRASIRAPEKVILLPAQPNVTSVFGAIDVSCVPSTTEESSPLVAMEAMASGLPVLCSDVGVLPKVLGDEFADLVLQRNSSQSLVDRLEHVRQNWTQERSHQIRRRAVDVFGPRGPVDAYERIMSEIR